MIPFLNRSAGVVLLSVFIGVSLQFLANSVDSDLVKSRVATAFRYSNLDTSAYPVRKYGLNSIRSEIGQDIFPDCKILLSLISSRAWSLKDAVLPPRAILTPATNSTKYCQQLHDITVGKADFESVILKARYWWGSRAIVGIGLQFFRYYQLISGIKSVTYLMYTTLAILILLLSHKALATAVPLIFFGITFSAIPLYGGTSLSIPYLWALIFNVVLAGMYLRSCSDLTVRLWMVFGGTLSAYLFLLDGHIMLLIALAGIITFHANRGIKSIASGIRIFGGHAIVFFGGFTIMMLVDFLVSLIYLDSLSTMSDYWNQLLLRLSSSAFGNELDMTTVLEKLFQGYKRVAAYDHPGIAALIE